MSSYIKSLVATALITTSVNASQLNLSNMPKSVANNSVAYVTVNNQDFLLSFNGLLANKTYKDATNLAFRLDVSSNQWQQISSVPMQFPTDNLIGRLASIAIGINEHAYIFGGYTVAKDHSEVSVPDVYKYHAKSDKYQQLAPMPVPVDDTVALVYQQKYIYLVSGWHNSGNVNLVQAYNTETNTWSQATPFPGKPVFGHAAGIVENTMIVCDGVKIEFHQQKRRSYAPEAACYKGVISADNPEKIDWFTLEHPTGIGRYRMAAVGNEENNEIIFVGGSDNPYNYNGIGYNGKPSEPDSSIWIYNVDKQQWSFKRSKVATMDHRGLLIVKGKWITLGGMLKNQQVTNQVIEHN